MSDFNVAVSQGLGFRVPLSEQEANTGFARIVVLGVRLSATAAASAAMVEELISSHQFSPKGFSLVPQGTPTNNTEKQRHRIFRQRSVRRPRVLHGGGPARIRSVLGGSVAEPDRRPAAGRCARHRLPGVADSAERRSDRRPRSPRDEHGALSIDARLLAEELDVAGRHARSGAADPRFLHAARDWTRSAPGNPRRQPAIRRASHERHVTVEVPDTGTARSRRSFFSTRSRCTSGSFTPCSRHSRSGGAGSRPKLCSSENREAIRRRC